MMNDRVRSPLPERHVQRLEHEFGPQMVLHRPPHDAATVDVDHHREIQEARPGRDVRDVRHPELIGGRGPG